MARLAIFAIVEKNLVNWDGDRAEACRIVMLIVTPSVSIKDRFLESFFCHVQRMPNT
jgi:hypothetical protein